MSLNAYTHLELSAYTQDELATEKQGNILLNAPIITAVELAPNPVDAGASYIIRVSIEEGTHDRLSDYTHLELSSYTHDELATEELT